MTEHTNRDEVWDLALRYALLEKSFNIDRIRTEITGEVSNRMIRDTLNTIVSLNWLAKDSQQADEWHPGPKARDIEDFDTEINNSSSQQEDVGIYSEVDGIQRRCVDRVSNSSNLVVEERTAGGHVLGTHGTLEEFVKVPHKNGEPLQVKLPRTYQQSRALICRDEDIVQDDKGIEAIKQPILRVDDIVPVQIPILIQTDESEREAEPEEIDGVPLPLFANVCELQLADSVGFSSGWRYAIKIKSINDTVARGTTRNRAKLSRRSNNSSSSGTSTTSNKSLDEIAEKVGEVTDSANTTAIGHIASGWDDRKKRLLSEVGSTYD